MIKKLIFTENNFMNLYPMNFSLFVLSSFISYIFKLKSFYIIRYIFLQLLHRLRT